MIARGVDDLAAVMQPGLRALLSLTAQGQDTTAAALTLWREFDRARRPAGADFSRALIVPSTTGQAPAGDLTQFAFCSSIL